MLKTFCRRRIYRVFAATFAISATVPLVSLATQHHNGTVPSSEHVCILPAIQPTAEAECTPQAVAYAAALVDLQDARKAASEAYQAWYECEYGGRNGTPTIDVPSAEHSILVRD